MKQQDEMCECGHKESKHYFNNEVRYRYCKKCNCLNFKKSHSQPTSLRDTSPKSDCNVRTQEEERSLSVKTSSSSSVSFKTLRKKMHLLKEFHNSKAVYYYREDSVLSALNGLRQDNIKDASKILQIVSKRNILLPKEVFELLHNLTINNQDKWFPISKEGVDEK